MEPNCPIPFSTKSLFPSPKSNSAAVISLSVSLPAQANETFSGVVPPAGIVDNPLHVGGASGTFVGVGVAEGVTVGVAEGVTEGVTSASCANCRVSRFCVVVPHTNIGTATMSRIMIIFPKDNFIHNAIFSMAYLCDEVN